MGRKRAKTAPSGTDGSEKLQVDWADGVQTGEEPVPRMRLRAICRGSQGTLGRIAWSPYGRFVTSPFIERLTCMLGQFN